MPNPGEKDAFHDKWDAYEDSFIPKGKGGGGKKKKKEPRDPRSKTAKAIKSNVIEASQDKRKEQAKVSIIKVLSGFPEGLSSSEEDSVFERYVQWLNASLKNNDDLVNEGDLSEEFVRSGKKAGGQNVNKVSSAVQLTHWPTVIRVRNEETRDQLKNRAKAREVLASKLEEHLGDWRTYLAHSKDKDTITTTTLMELLVE